MPHGAIELETGEENRILYESIKTPLDIDNYCAVFYFCREVNDNVSTMCVQFGFH